MYNLIKEIQEVIFRYILFLITIAFISIILLDHYHAYKINILKEYYTAKYRIISYSTDHQYFFNCKNHNILYDTTCFI